jgi:hypothetical protein
VPAALIDNPRLILTPHIGSATEETRRGMAENVIATLASEFGRPHVLSQHFIEQQHLGADACRPAILEVEVHGCDQRVGCQIEGLLARGWTRCRRRFASYPSVRETALPHHLGRAGPALSTAANAPEPHGPVRDQHAPSGQQRVPRREPMG